jgi:hypothetical protein
MASNGHRLTVVDRGGVSSPSRQNEKDRKVKRSGCLKNRLEMFDFHKLTGVTMNFEKGKMMIAVICRTSQESGIALNRLNSEM